MSDPISLRNIPPDALKLAHTLSEQTGLSLNAVFRLALASGLLVEATKVTPGPDDKFAGWEGPALAKALRRHLASAIDLLIEYGEHPYGDTFSNERRQPNQQLSGKQSGGFTVHEQSTPLGNAIEDDLDALGISFSLSEVLEDDR